MPILSPLKRAVEFIETPVLSPLKRAVEFVETPVLSPLERAVEFVKKPVLSFKPPREGCRICRNASFKF